MISLTSVSIIIKKLRPVLLFLVALIVLIPLVFLKIYNNQQKTSITPIKAPTIQQDYKQKTPKSISVSDSLLVEDVKIETPVFKKIPVKTNEDLARQYAALFSFTNEPRILQNQYLWQQDDKQLLVNDDEVSYKNSNTTNTKGVVSEEKLLGLSVELINKIGLFGQNYIQNKQKTKYYSIKKGLETTTGFGDSDIVEFSFDRTLNDLVVIDKTPYTSLIIVRIKKDGQVVFFSGSHFEKLEEQPPHKLISKEEFLTKVKEGKGVIVQTLLLDEYGQALKPYQFEPQDIDTAKITNIKLSYYISEDQNELVQPVWVASGEFLKNNKQGRIIVYYPAIKNLINPKP